MSGNHTRYSHQPKKHFTQLHRIQGAMITDADSMEAQNLAHRNTVHVGKTAIETGVPKTGGILTYNTISGPADTVTISGLQPGTVVADGHIGYLDYHATAEPDETWMALFSDQADLLDGPQPDARAVVYADLFQGHVGASFDARLVDAAFLGAETSVRKQQLTQLKFTTHGAAGSESALRQAIENNEFGLPIYGDFRLQNVTFETEIIAPDECDPCAQELTDENLDAGNHLFRLEVHQSQLNIPVVESGAATVLPQDQTIIVKFSRDNGSVEVPAGQASVLLADANYANAVFELTDAQAENRLGLYSDTTVDRQSSLFNLTDINDQLGGDLTGKVIRVWDGAVELDLSQNDLAPTPIGVQSATGSISKSGGTWSLDLTLGGLHLEMSAQTRGDEALPFVLPGDAYSVEIRETAGAGGEQLIWSTEPVEVLHAYTFLGILEDGEFINEDRPDVRSRSFPALTEIDGEDVTWSNHHHPDVDANTVQGAIDLLLARETEGDCQCTYCINPDVDLAEQLEEIAAELNGNAQLNALICLPAGQLEMSRPVKFEQFGNIVIRGAGTGVSHVLYTHDEQGVALLFQGGISATLEDCSFLNPTKAANVNFSAINVAAVFTRRVIFAVANTPGLISSAIVVVNTNEGALIPHSVEVRDCVFLGGPGVICCMVTGSLRSVFKGNVYSGVEKDVPSGSPPATGSGDFTTGISDKVDAIRNVIDKVELVANTLSRRRNKTGRYAEYAFNERLLMDMDAIPEEQRPAAAKYWSTAPTLLANRPLPETKKAFNATKEALGEVNDLTLILVKADNKHFVSSDRGAVLTFGKDTFDQEALTLLGNDDRQRVENIGGSLLGNPNVMVDYADLINDFVATPPDVEPEGTPPVQVPTYGIMVVYTRTAEQLISDNHFHDIEIAISVKGPDRFVSPFHVLATHGVTTIRENVVMRLFRTGSIAQNPNIPFLPKYPITCIGCESVLIENNTVEQSQLVDNDFMDALNPNLNPNDIRFAAIGLGGHNGHRTRVIGNTAQNFRHCVYTFGTIAQRYPGGSINYMNGFWTYIQNSVFPNANIPLGALALKNWAVEFADSIHPQINQIVRVEEWANHPDR